MMSAPEGLLTLILRPKARHIPSLAVACGERDRPFKDALISRAWEQASTRRVWPFHRDFINQSLLKELFTYLKGKRGG